MSGVSLGATGGAGVINTVFVKLFWSVLAFVRFIPSRHYSMRAWIRLYELPPEPDHASVMDGAVDDDRAMLESPNTRPHPLDLMLVAWMML